MKQNRISRRDFLKVSGIVLGTTALTCTGLGFAATRAPDIETPEGFYGKENPMNNKILVTYATRAGSTIEVAGAVGETLAARGYSVDVKPVKQNPNVDGYQAVIAGSAIRMGRWLPEAVNFIESNQTRLKEIPTAIFTVHMLNTGDDETSRAARQAYTAPVRQILNPAEEVFFAGKIDLAQLSWLDRLMVRMVQSPVGDYRDWDRIRDWAQTVLA